MLLFQYFHSNQCIIFRQIYCRTPVEQAKQFVDIKRVDRLPKRPIFQVYLKESLKKGSVCELELHFHSEIWESAEGLFKSSYINENGAKV